MKRKFFALCLFCMAVVAFTGCSKDEEDTTGSIYGLVTDADNGEPVKSANVSLNPGGKSAVTGTDGRYEFLDLEPGQYTVQVVKNGYESNTKRITVEVGKTASGDVVLSKASSKLKLNTNALNFGAGQTTLSFNISNIGTTGSISWTISSNLDWVRISPLSGTTATGKTSEVIVTLLRDKITGPVSDLITVLADGESVSVRISADVSSSGDDNTGDSGDSGNTGGNTGNVVVEPAHPDLPVTLQSAVRSGSNVTLTFSIQNNAGKDLTQLRLYSSYMGVKFGAYDDLGNSYDAYNVQEIKIGNQTSGGAAYEIWPQFPEGVKLVCTMTLKNISPEAGGFTNITIPCGSQPQITTSSYKIVFKNVNL